MAAAGGFQLYYIYKSVYIMSEFLIADHISLYILIVFVKVTMLPTTMEM